MRDGKRVQLDNVVFDTIEEKTASTSFVIDFKVLGEKKTVGSVLKEGELDALAGSVWSCSA